MNKNDKNKIMTALVQYAKFGEFSRFSDVISEERLSEIKVDELTDKIKNLIRFPYEIFFYGKDFDGFKKMQKIILKNLFLKFRKLEITQNQKRKITYILLIMIWFRWKCAK